MSARAASICSTTVGEVSLTWLPDGVHHVRPLAQYGGSTAEHFDIHPEVVDENGFLVMSLGSLLVESGDEKMLVDLAFGPAHVDLGAVVGGGFEGDLVGGSLLVSLAAVGLTPADIDGVLYSHLHPDHVGWVCDDARGEAVFPNATHYVAQAEWDYWFEGPGAEVPLAPSEVKRSVMGERLELVDDGHTPVAGVQFMSTPGHTPGHCSFVVSSGDQRAVILGDAIHCPVEISALELDFVFDVDVDLARRTKERIIRELEAPDTIAAGGHFPDLIFGRLVQADGTKRLTFDPAQVATP
jgi:glyoxylase-like metal-dependent hydrolase (beta-lactamase superfamily II)